MFQQRTMVREIGAAFAVLAIYILTLLLPLHQAAGLQRDLSDLGYETVGAWSVCASIAQDENGDDVPAAVKCPAAGIGKQDFAAPLPGTVAIEAPVLVATVGYSDFVQPYTLGIPDHVGQARAPPERV